MFDDLVALLVPSAAIALGFLLALSYYQSLCSRDVLVARAVRLAAGRGASGWRLGAVHAVAVLAGIPVLLVIWTVVLEFALLFIGSVDRLGYVATVAVVIVAATRLLAYARAAASHELAKAIPLSVAFVVLTGGSLNISANIERVVADPSLVDLTPRHLAFLVGLEWALRAATEATAWLRASLQTRRHAGQA